MSCTTSNWKADIRLLFQLEKFADAKRCEEVGLVRMEDEKKIAEQQVDATRNKARSQFASVCQG